MVLHTLVETEYVECKGCEASHPTELALNNRVFLKWLEFRKYIHMRVKPEPMKPVPELDIHPVDEQQEISKFCGQSM